MQSNLLNSASGMKPAWLVNNLSRYIIMNNDVNEKDEGLSSGAKGLLALCASVGIAGIAFLAWKTLKPKGFDNTVDQVADLCDDALRRLESAVGVEPPCTTG